ncbi:post-PEP-CTERM-1 domain-containing protein [Dyella silvatica]|uniref:post-PEP-CTERM-1 domain-containing protein n=1 Tax=Dyella silvatica TaxID=2992128 RepID=UPI002259330F|nr:hypothetical protein [Dyella silvatica]
MRTRIWGQVLSLTLAGPLLIGGAIAAEKTPAQTAPQSVTVQGVQVAIDPATGRLREPTAAEREALSKAMQQNAQQQSRAAAMSGNTFVRPLTEQDAKATTRTLRLRNGTEVVGMDLPESLVSNLVAEQQADGSLRIHHDGEAAGQPASKTQEVVR